jgi:hypothetical protein
MRRIGQCLNPKLTEIYKQAVRLVELNKKVIAYLPEPFRDHFSVGSFNQGQLVLHTLDPTWASQLRYQLPELRDYLRKEAGIYQLVSIKIMIVAHQLLSTNVVSKPHVLSAKARELIHAGSEHCAYPPLKAALRRLASTND